MGNCRPALAWRRAKGQGPRQEGLVEAKSRERVHGLGSATPWAPSTAADAAPMPPCTGCPVPCATPSMAQALALAVITSLHPAWWQPRRQLLRQW